MIFRSSLFFKELFLFGLTLLIEVFSAYNYAPLVEKNVFQPPEYTWDSIIIFMAVVTVMLMVMMRFKRVSAVSLKFFLLLVVFSGSQIWELQAHVYKEFRNRQKSLHINYYNTNRPVENLKTPADLVAHELMYGKAEIHIEEHISDFEVDMEVNIYQQFIKYLPLFFQNLQGFCCPS